MSSSAADIRNKTFEKNFRGYDKDEVTQYLEGLSQEWEALIQEKNELQRKLEQTEKEANKLKQVEESLFRTLKTAEDTGASIIEEATQAADEIMSAAQENSQGMLADAKTRSSSMLAEAKQNSEQLIASAEKKAKEIMDKLRSDVMATVKNYEALLLQRELLIKNLGKMSKEIEDTITIAQDAFKKNNPEIKDQLIKELAAAEEYTLAQVVHFSTTDLSNPPVNQEEEESTNPTTEVEEIASEAPEILETGEPETKEEEETSEPASTVPSAEIEDESEEVEEKNSDEEAVTKKELPQQNKGGSFFDQIE